MYPRRSIFLVVTPMLFAVAMGLGFPACYTGGEAEVPTKASTTLSVSTHNRLKFKGGVRYAADLSTALEVPRAEICKELSTYDCADTVHRIALGGVEPYRITLYQPLPNQTVSTANAVDRIALSACERRMQLDFAAPERAIVFGALQTPSPDVTKAVETLYLRLLRRPVLQEELAILMRYHTELVQERPTDANKRFATLAYFMVATTEESLFY